MPQQVLQLATLGSDFVVDPKFTRSIHVDAVYRLWVMDAVDGE